MTGTDSLRQRVRDGLLLDCYGSLLTEKQKLACDMVLASDFSLSEAAEALGVSRQGAHDLVTRSRERMEEYERLFSMTTRRKKREKLLDLLRDYKDRLPEDFYLEAMGILGGE